MDPPLNRNPPRVMHIDLNSCFASVEQQANPLLQGRPVAVAAYHTPSGVIVSPSIEAKARGVKTGMTVRDGRLLCPELAVLRPDPAKYRDVHTRLKRILRDYSPKVSPKSIDEAVVDFGPAGRMDRDLRDVGREIKRRLRAEVGEWMRASIGISTNRFLAKTAAGLRKPDGLDVITHENLRDVLGGMELTDLCGINRRYQARLYAAGIYTTTEFLDAPGGLLRDRVFGGINGDYWYLRLRGWEIDAVDHGRRSFGQMYSLPKATADPHELSPLLMKLCEKAGRRMRRAGYSARGIHLGIVYRDYTHWHRGVTLPAQLYMSSSVYCVRSVLTETMGRTLPAGCTGEASAARSTSRS